MTRDVLFHLSLIAASLIVGVAIGVEATWLHLRTELTSLRTLRKMMTMGRASFTIRADTEAFTDELTRMNDQLNKVDIPPLEERL